MRSISGLENLMFMILIGSPKKGEEFLAAKLSECPDVRDDVIKARRRLCRRNIGLMRNRGKILLTVFDMMVSGRNVTDIAKIIGVSRQYIDQVHKSLIKLPELEELKRNLRGPKSDDGEC